MRQATLVFVFNPSGEILLAMKKRGFWEGKWNGAGGKVETNETLAEAAARELQEETGISVSLSDLHAKGVLRFTFEAKPDWNQEVSVFTVRNYQGPDAQETEEMAPKWFKIDDIPYNSMWADDPYWLPSVIRDENVDFSFVFDEDGDLAEVVEGYMA